MRAVVTGASGFVGSALCRALYEAGHEVVALTRDPARAEARTGPGPSFVRGSIADPNQVARAAEGSAVLFHAAGIPLVPAPRDVLRWVHVAGTENVLTAARHACVDRIVHLSCADVTLHDGDRMHWDEKRVLPGKPVGPHAQTKLMAEELALAASDDELEVTALRPALVWGPGDIDGLAALVREARSGGVVLYGGGRNIVATTHIDNLIRAALAAADADAAPGRAYYVTDGEFIEARELYTKMLTALGLPAPRSGPSLGVALAQNRVRGWLGSDDGSERARLLRRGTSALFDLSSATADLDYRAQIDLDAAMTALRTWVDAQEGLDALVAKARPLPRVEDIAEQVAAADRA